MEERKKLKRTMEVERTRGKKVAMCAFTTFPGIPRKYNTKMMQGY